MLQVDVLVEVFDSLDAVRGQTEPGEKFELFQAFHRHDAIVRQVQDLQVAQLGHLEHAQELVVLYGELEINGGEEKSDGLDFRGKKTCFSL